VTDPGHGHAIQGNGGSFSLGVVNVAGGGLGVFTAPGATILTAASTATGLSVAATGGGETRPANAYVNWIIKD
jgi:hypothetical protein